MLENWKNGKWWRKEINTKAELIRILIRRGAWKYSLIVSKVTINSDVAMRAENFRGKLCCDKVHDLVTGWPGGYSSNSCRVSADRRSSEVLWKLPPVLRIRPLAAPLWLFWLRTFAFLPTALPYLLSTVLHLSLFLWSLTRWTPILIRQLTRRKQQTRACCSKKFDKETRWKIINRNGYNWSTTQFWKRFVFIYIVYPFLKKWNRTIVSRSVLRYDNGQFPPTCPRCCVWLENSCSRLTGSSVAASLIVKAIGPQAQTSNGAWILLPCNRFVERFAYLLMNFDRNPWFWSACIHIYIHLKSTSRANCLPQNIFDLEKVNVRFDIFVDIYIYRNCRWTKQKKRKSWICNKIIYQRKKITSDLLQLEFFVTIVFLVPASLI